MNIIYHFVFYPCDKFRTSILRAIKNHFTFLAPLLNRTVQSFYLFPNQPSFHKTLPNCIFFFFFFPFFSLFLFFKLCLFPLSLHVQFFFFFYLIFISLITRLYDALILGPPGPPEILHNKTQISDVNITLHWTSPSQRNCSITMYSLHHKVLKPTSGKEAEMNITNTSINSYELRLEHSKEYEVIVFAWNDLGRSEASRALKIRTAQCKYK